MKSMTQEALNALRAQHETWLRDQPGVVGTGIGLGRGGNLCIQIYADRISAATRNAIHEKLGGAPVEIEEIGGIQKQNA